jgi:hypothetical protein
MGENMLRIFGSIIVLIFMLGQAVAQRDCEILGNCEFRRDSQGGGDRYAAYAYSPSDGKTGASWAWPTQADAENAAVNACKQDGGQQCRSVVWGRNTCVALATGRGTWGIGLGSTHNKARINAIYSCNCNNWFNSSCASGYQTGLDQEP